MPTEGRMIQGPRRLEFERISLPGNFESEDEDDDGAQLRPLRPLHRARILYNLRVHRHCACCVTRKALRARPAVNPAQKFLFVQEKIACQYALEVQLLKKIARGHGHFTKRILPIAGLQLAKIWRASANFCTYRRSNPALSSGTGVKAGESRFGAPLAKPSAGHISQ